MSYYTGRVTLSSSGNNSFTGPGFKPTWIRVKFSQKDGVSETCNHFSLGNADGTRQNCSSLFSDTTFNTCFDSGTKLVSHWENQSGTLVEVAAGTFGSFDTLGYTINMSTPNNAYKATVECGN